MINAKDLRLGNWVKVFTTETPVKVTGIMHKKDGDIVYYIQPKQGTGSIQTDDNFPFIEGIPLSPEILEKAGFQKGESTLFSLMVPVYSNGDLTLRKPWSNHNPEWYAFTHLIDVRLYNLHQLQNLFYAISGTELLINL